MYVLNSIPDNIINNIPVKHLSVILFILLLLNFCLNPVLA